MELLELEEKEAEEVEGLKWQSYEAELEGNFVGLQGWLHRGARPCPRRFYMPRRMETAMLAIAALEDKSVHRATAAVLHAFYEEDSRVLMGPAGRSA